MPRFDLRMLALVSTIAGSTAALGQPLDAAQYVQRVLGEGPSSRVAEAEAALARAESVGIGRWPNPSISWQRESTSGSPAQDLFLASVPLALSGRPGLEAAAADLRAQAGAQRLIRARAALHRDALERFNQVLAAAQRRATVEDSLKVLDGLLQVITAREKAGESSGYDLLRISLERTALETSLAGEIRVQHRATHEALALLPTGAAASFAGTLATPASAVAGEELEARRADLKALELEAQAGEEERRAGSRGWIPDPVVSGGVQMFGLGQQAPVSLGYVVGVSIPLPLFQRHTGVRAQGEARKQLAQAQRELLLHHARRQLDSVSSEVQSRRAQLEHHQLQVVPRAQQLREVASAAYRGGAAELLVLVDAERTSREARLTTVELQLELARADRTLQFLSGSFDQPLAQSSPR